MKLRDRVKLNPASRWNDGEPENPLDTYGTIVYEEHQNSGLQLTVAWNNGALNAYNEEDLILIPAEEEKPAFDRTAIAVQILSGMMPQRQVAQIQSNKEEIVAVAIELTDELIKQLSDE